METLNGVGMFILFFIVLPNSDVTRGIMLMSGTAVIPSVLSIFLKPKDNLSPKLITLMDVVALISQVSALFVWLIIAARKTIPDDHTGDLSGSEAWRNVCMNKTFDEWSPLVGLRNVAHPLPESPSSEGVYLIPVALFLISLTWWENFVDETSRLGRLGKWLRKVHIEVRAGKTKIYALVYLWKAILIFFLVFMVYGANGSVDSPNSWSSLSLRDIFTNQTSFGSFIRNHHYKDNHAMDVDADWLTVFGIHAGVSLLGYVAARWAIQADVQKWTFSVALSISTPASILVAVGFCEGCKSDWNIANKLPGDARQDVDVYWNCYSGHAQWSDLLEYNPIIIIGFLWWVGQLCLSRYIWTPKCQPLAKTDR